MIDALGGADADARVRAQAMRRAGPAVRATALPWWTPGEGHGSSAPPPLADREERFRRAVHNACAAYLPECVVLAASEPVAARLAPHVPRETPLRWWPTAVLDLAVRNGPPLAPLALAVRDPDGGRDDSALPALDAAVIRAPRSGERVSLWDGDYVLVPGPLSSDDGREIMEAFAHVDEAALDLVVLAAPQPELIALARGLGIGARVHFADPAPRDAELTWLGGATAAVLPSADAVSAGLVCRALACGAALLTVGQTSLATRLSAWLAARGCSPAPAGSLATRLEHVIARGLDVERAVAAGRSLAARHDASDAGPSLAGRLEPPLSQAA
jgi:hypothetical protein